MLSKDNIKIKYSEEGYLPNFPPHLISDEEMCQAFLTNEFSYFYDNYPLLTDTLSDSYQELLNAIRYHIVRLVSKVEGFQRDLPNWVYSYMLGQVINDNSDQQDRHYFLVGINRDNIEDIMTPEAQVQCYEFSSKWVNKLDKSVKVENINKVFSSLPKESQDIASKELEKWEVEFSGSGEIVTRPPTMFGEPHVIKLIRINEVS